MMISIKLLSSYNQYKIYKDLPNTVMGFLLLGFEVKVPLLAVQVYLPESLCIILGILKIDRLPDLTTLPSLYNV